MLADKTSPSMMEVCVRTVLFLFVLTSEAWWIAWEFFSLSQVCLLWLASDYEYRVAVVPSLLDEYGIAGSTSMLFLQGWCQDRNDSRIVDWSFQAAINSYRLFLHDSTAMQRSPSSMTTIKFPCLVPKFGSTRELWCQLHPRSCQDDLGPQFLGHLGNDLEIADRSVEYA